MWIKPLINSLQVMCLSTPTAVILGFIYAYAMAVQQDALETILSDNRHLAAAVAAIRRRRELHFAFGPAG